MQWVRRILLGFLVALCLALAVYAFRPEPVPVETAKVERGLFVETVDEPGKTRVRERFTISAPVSGELERVQLSAGDAVKAGQVLAVINPLSPQMLDVRAKGELEARVRAAQAAATVARATVEKAKDVQAFAKQERDRIKGLADKGALPGNELDRAEHELRVAEKDLRSANLNAQVAIYELEVAKAALGAATGEKTTAQWVVRSPLDGRVLKVVREDAGVVQAGAPLLEVADPHDLEVVASLLTSDAVRIRPGARSTFERWGGEKPLEGRVRTIEPSGYTKLSALGVEEQRVDVILDIVSPPSEWAALGDGFRVHTRTEVYRTPDAVKAPSAALFRDGDKWALFTVSGGKAWKKYVDVARRNGPEAMITGIEPGTTVVAFPSNDVADGEKVAVQ